MAKAPRIGHGKSRLAAGLGRVEAWRINRALQARCLRQTSDPRWRRLLLVSPNRECQCAFPGVWPAHLARRPQGGGDLGERLARAFRQARNGEIAVIGVDCPDADRARIAELFEALARAPHAIGLAEDGGFWGLATRKPRVAAKAFARVRWSTAFAGADMAAALGRVAHAARLADIDTAEAWRAYRASERSKLR
jgi:hypothetical protein